MNALAAPVMLYCERCRRRTPHSRRGKCLELHRTKRLRYAKPADDLARWHAVKAQVFERDGYRCQFPPAANPGGWDCLAPLDAHHRRIKGAGGVSDDEWEYGPAGLLSLCRRHHDIVHEQMPRDEAERLGLIIPRSSSVAASLVALLTADGWVQLLGDGSRIPVQIYARDDE